MYAPFLACEQLWVRQDFGKHCRINQYQVNISWQSGEGSIRGERKKKGLWALLWEVLVSPGEAFEELVAQEQPPFLAAALLFTGIAVVLAVVLIPKMQANALWLAQNNPKVTPEQLATGRPIIAIMAAAFLIVGALVVPWLYWLVVAVLLKLYDALFGGRGTSFRALFAVAVYGFLPIQLAAIIAAPIILMTAVENMPWTSLSLAAFVNPQKTYLYLFLKQWNPFTWWSLALWGIGWAKCAQPSPRAYSFSFLPLAAVIIGYGRHSLESGCGYSRLKQVRCIA